jgi:carbon storage regulator
MPSSVSSDEPHGVLVLILSRKPGESLVLDGGIRIDILATDGRTVRIGIDAPQNVRILRAEIVESVEQETRRAAEAAKAWAASSAAAGSASVAPPRLVTPPSSRDDSPAATEG